MLEQLAILVICLELIVAQGTCNRAIPVSHNGVSSSISYDEFKQALGEVSTALSDALDTRCQICGQRGDLDDVPRDCQDVLDLGYRTTGVYMTYPARATPFKVRCDQTTDGGGWIVIQRRVSYSDFFKSWQEYKDGFGDLNGNFWLGNDKIHTVTASGHYSLRVDLTGPSGETRYAKYTTFIVGDESSKYRLTVSGYSGTAGDALAFSNGMMFSTYDQNNDQYGGSSPCAEIDHGAWWYKDCYKANLNGRYGAAGGIEGVNWYLWLKYVSMTRTEMKIKKT